MTARSLFEALVRALGLFFAAEALFAVIALLNQPLVESTLWLQFGVRFVVGILLLARADVLADLLYRTERGHNSQVRPAAGHRESPGAE